ncbi:hypothetical protein NSK_008231 [Nannochloropsis salina CCMP1776]|uniref:Anaphase-promoting complex subunit 2 n=1 Tax=Nannochloropsis salina CCMP1776 TaxID=1027361 RepID=A0A4D9CMZ7_9STRA|nr:hypothetical protein NSK_008231 [Nannochloropsis salina CCMP1776]|eukprot:TFJ80490.1 hypothetical protein NSK_008231 [Nannochloropsis salina CCMP1776]
MAPAAFLSSCSPMHDDEGGMEAVKDAWVEVYEALDRHLLFPSKGKCHNDNVQLEGSSGRAWLQSVVPLHALRLLQKAGLGSLAVEYVADCMDHELARVVKPVFWEHFDDVGTGREEAENMTEMQEHRRVSPHWVIGYMGAALSYADQALRERRAKLAMVAELILPAEAGRLEHMLRTRLAAFIFNTAPDEFYDWWVAFFETSLRAWHWQWRRQRRQRREGRDGEEGSEEGDILMSVEEAGDAGYEEDEEAWEDWGVHAEEVETALKALRRLHWLPLVQSTITSVVKRETEKYIERTCAGVYDKPCLRRVEAWRDAVLMPWLAGLLGKEEEVGGGQTGRGPGTPSAPGLGTPNAPPPTSPFPEWRLRHSFVMQECFVRVRMLEMFDIVRDYPDTVAAARDLRAALEVTQQHQQLAACLCESMRQRLLHVGANTMQALRVVDPTDALLECVAGPLRSYLQGRPDTVRCIVSSLTDDEQGGVLYEELRRHDAAPLCLDEEEEEEEEEGEGGGGWMPAGREGGAARIGGDGRGAGEGGNGGEVLRMLVSIYGSKDLFAAEYRLMLAEKLLNSLTLDTDRELTILELLKLKFGEGGALQPCEIMLRDLEESKRVNGHVAQWVREQARAPRTSRGSVGMEEEAGGGIGEGEGRMGEGGHVVGSRGEGGDTDRDGARADPAREAEAGAKDTVVDATIISHHFWPPLQEEEMTLHPRMGACLDGYGRAYAVLKNPRKLEWKAHLGLVHIELEFEGAEGEEEEDRKGFGGREGLQGGGVSSGSVKTGSAIGSSSEREKGVGETGRGARLSLKVSPVHASLIMHFEDRDEWTLQELAHVMGIDADLVARKMAFWVNQGVVASTLPSSATSSSQAQAGASVSALLPSLLGRPTGGLVYRLLHRRDQEGGGALGRREGTMGMEEDDLEAAVSSDAQEAQEMDLYISYVVGMLGTYGGRSVRAIHDTLRIWVGGERPMTALKLPEVEKILNRLVEERKVEMVDGVYQLVSRPAHHRQ